MKEKKNKQIKSLCIFENTAYYINIITPIKRNKEQNITNKNILTIKKQNLTPFYVKKTKKIQQFTNITTIAIIRTAIFK